MKIRQTVMYVSFTAVLRVQNREIQQVLYKRSDHSHIYKLQ